MRGLSASAHPFVKSIAASEHGLRYVFLGLILVAMFIFFHFQSPYFLHAGNLLNIANQLAETGFIAIAMTVIILSGAMDLSVGSIVGLSAAIMGLAYQAGMNIWLSACLALVVGACCGSMNGYLIAKFKMQAIIVTIGTMVMLRGLIYVCTGGRPLSGFPESFYFLGQGDLWGLPVNAVILIALFIVFYMLLTKSPFGRYIYALGNNEEGVKYSGVQVVRVRFISFVISGVLSALAGIFLVSRLASAEATSGQGFELEAITAVLLGGTSIFGGRGSLPGTFLGLLIIVVLRNGLNMMGVSTLFQTVILGIFILLATALNKQQSS